MKSVFLALVVVFGSGAALADVNTPNSVGDVCPTIVTSTGTTVVDQTRCPACCTNNCKDCSKCKP